MYKKRILLVALHSLSLLFYEKIYLNPYKFSGGSEQEVIRSSH